MSQKKSYGLLEGKRGIVFGPLDESSIGWQIALAAHREGAKLAISNVAIALRVGKVRELAELCGNAPVIQCDATSNEEIDAAFKQLKEELGPVDFIIHSIGMSQNIRKGLPYNDLNYDWYLRTLDVSATYRLQGSRLRLEFEASSDAPTPFNPTHHPYFNLAGDPSVPAAAQWL